MIDGRILTVDDGLVRTITIDRPARKNALAGTMREDLAAAFEESVGRFPERTRVVVLRGEHDAFCAGGDVANLATLRQRGDTQGLKTLLAAGERAIRAIRSFPGPVVASIDGPAMGAGLAIACACDLRIATLRAVFGMAFSKIGLHPDWGASALVAEVVGVHRARELALTGRMIKADEAVRIGLVHQAVPAEELRTHTAGAVAGLLAAAPLAQAAIKRTFAAGMPDFDEGFLREAEAQVPLFESADGEEGFAAFLARRPALWSGR